MPVQKTAKNPPTQHRLWVAHQFKRTRALILAGLLTAAGIALVVITQAASFVVEAETMTVTGYANTAYDSTASGSTMLAFWGNATAAKQFALGAPASSFTIRARGAQCYGAPQMDVKIDNVAVLSKAISTVGWTDFTTTYPLPAGNHSIAISFSNDYYLPPSIDGGDSGCSRDLFIDKLTFQIADASALVEKAKGKYATSSQIDATGHEAAKANDGSTSTRWSSIYQDNQWWKVDLGAATPVSQIDVNWEAAYGKHYYLEGSLDGTNYFRLADVTNARAGLVSSSFDETTARYIRLYGLTRGTQWGFSFWELQVYGRSITAPAALVAATISVPQPGATISGGVPVAVTASATNGVARVEFYLDGTLKMSDTTAPYCMASSTANPCTTWDSRSVSNGSHTLTAYAYDVTGVKSPPSTVTVTVNNSVTQPGLYMGPANTTGHNQFSSWLGNEAYYAVDFLNDAETWDQIANANWLFDPWSAWVKAKPGRRMVISVPMLNQASAGQLDTCADTTNTGHNFDPYFRTLSQNLITKGLGNSVIRLGWEANGDWYSWKASTNQTAWKNCYRRIVGVMRTATVSGYPAASYAFDLNYNLGTSGTAVSFASMYPGDDVVDYLGIDVYDVKWMDTTSSSLVRWNNLLNQPMGLNDFKAFATLHNKPMSIPEWGLRQPGTQDGGIGDNPCYIDYMADWLAANAPNVAFQSYFNHLSGWTGDHRIAYWAADGSLQSPYPNAKARYLARFGANPQASACP